MSFKERIEKYLEEKGVEQAKRLKDLELEKIEIEREREKRERKEKEEEGKKIKINQEKIKPFIEALSNKVPVAEWLEEIKKEREGWLEAKIILVPTNLLSFNEWVELRLVRDNHYTKPGYSYWETGGNFDDREVDIPPENRHSISYLGVGVFLDQKKFMKFYGCDGYYDENVKYDYKSKQFLDKRTSHVKDICLVDDPESFQKIEKFLIEKAFG